MQGDGEIVAYKGFFFFKKKKDEYRHTKSMDDYQEHKVKQTKNVAK